MRHLALLAAFSSALFAGCSPKSAPEPIQAVKSSDPDMNAAIANARAKLPDFWNVFDHPDPGESGFALKVRITDSNGIELFWVGQIERKDGQIFGTIDNEAEIVKSVKSGDRITIPDTDITDWMYYRNGKIVGNYTIRVLFKQMSPTEVEKYEAVLANP